MINNNKRHCNNKYTIKKKQVKEMENDNLNNGHIIEIKPNMFEKVADDFS